MRTNRKRRKEHKTDYGMRLKLLKSGMPRIVVRKTNKYLIAQAVTSKSAQDSIIVGVTSGDLLNHGWDKNMKGSLKSIPAAYLTGILLGNRIKEKKQDKNEFILDLGMNIKRYKGRLYAVAKGVVDSGIKLKVNKKVFPDEARLNGEHINEKLKQNIEKIKSNLTK